MVRIRTTAASITRTLRCVRRIVNAAPKVSGECGKCRRAPLFRSGGTGTKCSGPDARSPQRRWHEFAARQEGGFHNSATRFVFHRTLPHTARCVREHGRAWERNLLNGIPRASACHQGYGHNAQATLPTRLIRPRAPECAPHPICLSDSAVTFFVGYVVTVAREAVRRYTRFSALHP